MRALLEIAVVAAGSYLFFASFALLAANRSIFRAQRSSYRDGSRISKITADDGTPISALRLPAPSPRGFLLYLHGNAEDLGDVRWHLELLQERGYTVLALDYRGYGTTPGSPNERNVYADSAAALRHFCALERLEPEDVIVYGRSLGGGPAVELAVRHPIGGLVLEGAFVSAFRVVTRVPVLPCDRFRNAAKLQRVKCPLLFIHGQADRTVPFWHGEQLLRAARPGASHLWVAGAGHNDLVEVARERYWEALAALSDRARAGRS